MTAGCQGSTGSMSVLRQSAAVARGDPDRRRLKGMTAPHDLRPSSVVSRRCRTWRRSAIRCVGVLAAGIALVLWARTTVDAAGAPKDPGPGGTERISFSPGTDNATVSGTFSEGSDDHYVLTAGAGQTMTVAGSLGGLSVAVFAPDGSQLAGRPGNRRSSRRPCRRPSRRRRPHAVPTSRRLSHLLGGPS